jgi:hypothetical protein
MEKWFGIRDPNPVAFTCFIDYYKWSDNRFTWKKLVALGSTILVPTLIVIWALAVEVL